LRPQDNSPRCPPHGTASASIQSAMEAVSRIYFRADAGFANPDVYEFLEAERIKYAIRLPANRILQERIGHLLTRPIGRPPNEVRRSYANFTYQAGSWTKPRRVIAKVEWHPGESRGRSFRKRQAVNTVGLFGFWLRRWLDYLANKLGQKFGQFHCIAQRQGN
jgi:hypothetical protein